MRRSSAKRTPASVDLDAEELEVHEQRAHALGFVIARLSDLGPTPIDERAVDVMRARIAKRIVERAKKART